MSREPDTTARDLFRQWQGEVRELEGFVDGLRDWMQKMGEGSPYVWDGPLVGLLDLKTRLRDHFDREDRIIAALASTFDHPPTELDATLRQAKHDHRQLIDRLDRFVERLRQFMPSADLRPEPEAWDNALAELELFVDLLEQHEDQENESIELLMPYDPEHG